MALALLQKLNRYIKAIKSDIYALYFAARDKRTPCYVKFLVACIVAYAISPIDLIPDFIPIIGYLDDIILLPIAILLAIKLVPTSVMIDCRLKAKNINYDNKPTSIVAAAIIILIWLLAVAFSYHYFYSS